MNTRTDETTAPGPEDLLKAINAYLGGPARGLPGRVAVVRAAISAVVDDPSPAGYTFVTGLIRRNGASDDRSH